MAFIPDSIPDPVLVYSNTKLIESYDGPACTVQKSLASTSEDIEFDGSDLDVAALQTFLTGEPYGRILSWPNQAGDGNDAVKSSDISVQPPRIHWSTDYMIGGIPSMLFEGGSHGGEVWGLDIEPPLQPLAISGRNWTVMMVVRPTSSIFRNQNRTPDTAEGTFFSLEASLPFAYSGDTVTGSPTITNVTPTAGIEVGMVVSGAAFPYGDSFISAVEIIGSVATITVFGAGAVADFTGATILLSMPLGRMYANGDGASGGLSISDGRSINYQPTDFSGLEIGPSVLTFRSNFTFSPAGLSSYMNDLVQSSPLISTREISVNTGFIGRWGGAIRVDPPYGGLSKSGDFWCVAVLAWNVTLTDEQVAIMRDAVYVRFEIDQTRSNRYGKSVTFVGDSIYAGYNASLGLYGMVPRFQDKFVPTGSPPVARNVRVMNYAVPGSQITANTGSPVYASTEGLFEAGIARNMAYSSDKNVLVIGGGGNDMIWAESVACTFTNTSPGQVVATPTTDAWAVDQRVVFTLGSGALPALITAGTFYYVKTVVDPTHITVAATPGGTAINFTGSSGTHSVAQYSKTAATIYAGIRRIVDSATANGASKVYVCTVMRRTGDAYNFVLDATNTLIRAGDGVNGYTVIDMEADATLNNNDSPPNVVGPAFPDGTHPNDVGFIAAANLLYSVIAPYLFP